MIHHLQTILANLNAIENPHVFMVAAIALGLFVAAVFAGLLMFSMGFWFFTKYKVLKRPMEYTGSTGLR